MAGNAEGIPSFQQQQVIGSVLLSAYHDITIQFPLAWSIGLALDTMLQG